MNLCTKYTNIKTEGMKVAFIKHRVITPDKIRIHLREETLAIYRPLPQCQSSSLGITAERYNTWFGLEVQKVAAVRNNNCGYVEGRVERKEEHNNTMRLVRLEM